MPRHRFKLQPIEMSFFDDAPGRYSEVIDIPLPTEQVWAQLTSENPFAWCRLLQRITWTSPRPLGLGATRSAKALGGALVIDEEFIHWEEGHRQSFMVVGASMPIARRFGEDCKVEAMGDASCRFTWTIAVESQPLMRAGRPINGLFARSLLRDTRRHFGVTSSSG
jgi:Polyketide cyclase / dehydrase and lipid transport